MQHILEASSIGSLLISSLHMISVCCSKPEQLTVFEMHGECNVASKHGIYLEHSIRT